MKQKFLILFCLVTVYYSEAQVDSIAIAKRDSIILDSIITEILNMPIINTGTGGTFNTSDIIIKFDFDDIKAFKRNDTIFVYEIYQTDKQIDSVKLSNIITIRLTRRKWAQYAVSETGSSGFGILKYKRLKPSEWFIENNDKYFHAEYECYPISIRRYYSDGSRFVYWRFLGISYTKLSYRKF
jgi:hypothetical protein